MKHRTLLMFVVRLVIGVVICLLLWNPVGMLIRTFGYGVHGFPRAHDLGDGYEVWSGGGIHLRITHNGRDEIIEPIHRDIEKWGMNGQWLYGITEGDDSAWFVINKKTRDVFFPLPSEKEVKEITGLDIASSDLTLVSVEPPSPSYPINFRFIERCVVKARIILLLIPLLIGFGPNVWQLLRLLIKRIRSVPVKSAGS